MAPSVIIQSSTNGYKYSHFVRIIAIGGTVALNHYTDKMHDDALYGLCTMINYDLIVMAMGLVDTVYMKEQEKARAEILQGPMTFLLIFCFYLQYSICAPVSKIREGNIWNYPIYVSFELESWFVLGTWYWVYVTTYMFELFTNSKFQRPGETTWFYDLLVG